jgi:hypothetical protein
VGKRFFNWDIKEYGPRNTRKGRGQIFLPGKKVRQEKVHLAKGEQEFFFTQCIPRVPWAKGFSSFVLPSFVGKGSFRQGCYLL